MTDTTISPKQVGGRFTNIQPYAGQPVVFAQDGGRRRTGGWAGSAAPVTTNWGMTDDGSCTGLTGNWNRIYLSEGRKNSTWQGPPFVTYPTDYTLGTLAPHVAPGHTFISSLPYSGSSNFGGTMAWFDNDFNGEAGPDVSWVRDAGNWGVTSSNPAPDFTHTQSVKTYPANQFNFTTPTPVSSFNSIRSYASCNNPLLPASAYPLIDYEAAWDIFGTAHFNTAGITLECMFWTRNHNQGPNVGTLAETGINFGDGKLWDLYTTTSTASDGGVSAQYSYGIFYLEEAYQEESGWVDILAGLRYFLMHYVIPDGTGAPASPLDCPITQITRGWEICSTNYQPLEFRHLDYKLIMT